MVRHHIIFCIIFVWLSTFGIGQVSATSGSTIQPFFQNGQAQKVKGFGDRKEWIKHELWVETKFDSDADGKLDRLHVMVTRPYQTDTDSLQLPAIYISSPYFGGLGKNKKRFHWDPRTQLGEVPKPHKHPSVRQKKRRNLQMFTYDIQWVPRGYVMVYSSSPGTGLSDGAPTIGGENETLAPKAVIDWLCGRAKGFSNRDGNDEVKAFWCSKKVGMIGASYNGTLALAAATTGVEGLEAIIPIAPVTSWYDYYRSNGLVRSPGGYVGEDMDVLFDGIHSGDKARRKSNSERVRDSILVPGQDRVTGDYNQFWEARNYLNQMHRMRAAMFIVHSFNDWNVMVEHTIKAYQKAKEKNIPVKMYIGQGGHGSPPPFELMNLWFTKYLHGHENEVEKLAEVLIDRPGYRSAVAYQSFPNELAEKIPFFMSKDGNHRGGLNTTKSASVGELNIVDNYKLSPEKMALADSSISRLLYETPVLQNELHLSGFVEVKIKLKSNAPAVNLSAYLVALNTTENGKTNYTLITRGWADPQNDQSLSMSAPLKPNEFVNLNFTLVPDDQIIAAGNRIALMVFSSDKEFTLHPEPGSELTIDLNETSVLLPIVGGKEAYANAIKKSK